ncbi:sensor histidine kinase [Bacillus sp. V2I10]|uniref:sensor histidine kinase n=1 Tax=Bacillus sp. V2I10 TaxID=3042276 RepID=UPI002782F913|nr:sensor histidine kinase [Bacillus sp. V2I10]MDQ0857647.1 two-component system sensor histidine kinase ComP [Bacillus sp. V2I10]
MKYLNFNKLYFITLFLSFILVVYFLSIGIKYPYVGASVRFNDADKLEITLIEPNTWASKVGLKIGDTVTRINHEHAHEHYPAVRYGMLEQLENVTIERDGNDISYVVKDSIISHQSLFLVVVPIILYVLCLFCSYFIYKTNKKLKLQSAFLLNIFLLMITLAHFSGTGSSRGDVLSRYMNLSFFLSVPVTYMSFLYYYFKELGKKLFSEKFLYVSFLIVAINIVAELCTETVNLSYSFFYIFVKNLNLASFVILFALTFIVKFIGLKKVRYSAQGYLVKILIITNIVAFSPFVFLYILPYVFLNRHIFPPNILAAFLLLIPFSLVYQFLATKIYDIEFILGRVRYYALLAVLPTVVCVSIMLIIKENSPTFYPIKLSIFIYITMLVVFYFKEILDFRFRFKRFSEKYNYQDSIFKYTQSIRKASKLHHVINELKQVITDVLLVSRANYVEVDKSGNIISVEINMKDTDYLSYEKEIKKATQEIGKIIEVDRGFVINVGETDDRSYVMVCLSMLNTPKLNRDEISWLKTLSFYTNISLENFLKIEELMNHLQKIESEGSNPAWLTKVLFSIEEKQRSNLAKDLHDSVLQDLISLKRQGELALAELEMAPTVFRDQLKEMNSSMTNIIKTTRETCQELRPQLLYDLGLVKALQKLAAQYNESAAFDVRLNTGNFTKAIDIDTQLNLYRIVQELLTNADKHSNALNVLIMLVCIKDKIVLHYEDDGIGFDQSELYSNNQSMGLSGITERVKALNGSLHIETSKGNGFKVVVEI